MEQENLYRKLDKVMSEAMWDQVMSGISLDNYVAGSTIKEAKALVKLIKKRYLTIAQQKYVPAVVEEIKAIIKHEHRLP